MNAKDHPFIPYQSDRLSAEHQEQKGQAFYTSMNARRSVRFFSAEPVPKELIEFAIKTASTAPSGAHMQPWTFVAISCSEIKKEIRMAAEREERISYEGRMKEEWLDALRPLGTDWHKPYLETVPWIVVVFAQRTGLKEDGSKLKHYYVSESVGIACGLFVAALHQMGLATLTHTPSPMSFLSKILKRPKNESPFILFPIGYPAAECQVPDIKRKPLDQIVVWKESE